MELVEARAKARKNLARNALMREKNVESKVTRKEPQGRGPMAGLTPWAAMVELMEARTKARKDLARNALMQEKNVDPKAVQKEPQVLGLRPGLTLRTVAI